MFRIFCSKGLVSNLVPLLPFPFSTPDQDPEEAQLFSSLSSTSVVLRTELEEMKLTFTECLTGVGQ